MTGHRRAAAALHNLQEKDRRWLLSELPAADRDILVRLLGELTELGFESGSTAISVASPALLDEKQTRHASSTEIVRSATAHDMLLLLEQEPSSLIAQILGMEDWPWKQAFLQMLPALRRDRIVAMQFQPGGNARLAFLLDRMAGQLRASSNPDSTVTRASRARMLPYGDALTTFLNKVKRWKR